MDRPALRALIAERARDEGFSAVGFCAPDAIPQAAGLFGAPRRVVLGVEIEEHGPLLQGFFQTPGLAILIPPLDQRRFPAGFGGLSRMQVQSHVNAKSGPSRYDPFQNTVFHKLFRS